LRHEQDKRIGVHLQNNWGKAILKWTGFSGKTGWDWLQLLSALAIPVVVAFVSISFSMQQDASNQWQHQTDLKIAQDNRQKDIHIADDQQQEAALKTYLDDMSDLLLNHNLRMSKPTDEVSEVARERTLTALRRLDAKRNKVVLQFIQDAHLAVAGNAVIDLSSADLSRADLKYVDLRGVGLRGIDLSGADLKVTDLRGTDLSSAVLENADLRAADLSDATLDGADLRNVCLRDDARLRNAHLRNAYLYGAELVSTDLGSADLSGADLSGADLSGADLSGADLSFAHLNSAVVTQKQLAQAKSLKGTIMVDGSVHP
jgi:uncharacterized protein YjbI with pentapeptide repeats